MKPLELKEHEPFDDGEWLVTGEQDKWCNERMYEAIEAMEQDVEWQKRELKRIGGNIDE